MIHLKYAAASPGTGLISQTLFIIRGIAEYEQH